MAGEAIGAHGAEDFGPDDAPAAGGFGTEGGFVADLDSVFAKESSGQAPGCDLVLIASSANFG